MPRRAPPKQSPKMPPKQKTPTPNPGMEKSIQTDSTTTDSRKNDRKGPATPESIDNGSLETATNRPSTPTPTPNKKRAREEDSESTQDVDQSSTVSCPGCRKSLDSYELLGRHVANCHLLRDLQTSTEDDTNTDDGEIDTSLIPNENIISQHGDVVIIALRVDHSQATQAPQHGVSNGEQTNSTNDPGIVETVTNQPQAHHHVAQIIEPDWSDDESLYGLAGSVASGETFESAQNTAFDDLSDSEDSVASSEGSYDSDLEDDDWDEEMSPNSGSHSEDTLESGSSAVEDDDFEGFDWTEIVEGVPEHWEPEALPYRPDAEIQPKQMFLVSSQVLIAGSPVFAKMLNQDSKFSEGVQLRKISGRKDRKTITITLDDDADTLALVLKILHHSNSKLPKSIDLYQMRNLAILTDKYQLHESIQLRADVWATPLRKKHPNNLNWLVIGWTFGYAEEFRTISEIVADRFVYRGNQLQLSASETPEGPWIKLLDSTPTIVVERLESLVIARRQTLANILHSIRTGRTSVPPHEAQCTRPRIHHVDRRACDLFQIGSLVQEFATHDAFAFLRPSEKTEYATSNLKSVLDLVAPLCNFTSIELETIEEKSSWEVHEKCSWVLEMRAKVAKFAVEAAGLELGQFPSRRELGFGTVEGDGAVAVVAG